MMNVEQHKNNLKQIALTDHGNSTNINNTSNNLIDKNRWKNRTSSEELKEDFKDIFALREQLKNDHNSIINNVNSNNDNGLLSSIMNELEQITKRDTKKLWIGLDNLSQKQNKEEEERDPITQNKNNKTESDEDDLIELMTNTKNVTEKIKYLNIFDDYETPQNFEQNHQNTPNLIVTDEPDTDIEMIDYDAEGYDDDELFLMSDKHENRDYNSNNNNNINNNYHIPGSDTEDSVMLDMDVNKNNISAGNILKSIINPTELGVQFAQSVLEKEEQKKIQAEPISTKETKTENLKENVEKDKQDNKGEESEIIEEVDGTEPNNNGSYKTIDKQGNTITINNHYYNYFHMGGLGHPNYYRNEFSHGYENYEVDYNYNNKKTLPNPWSSNSTPLKKEIYNLTSYCQIILNTSLYFLAILLIFIFTKTITQDLANLFYQQKQHHISDVARCGQLYDINKCHLGIPKMVDQCTKWQSCMVENVDKKFINKTKIFIRLIAELFGEFLKTIGFLNSVSLFMLLYSCYFIINLFFGYIRGKSYGSFTNKTRSIIEDSNENNKENIDYNNNNNNNNNNINKLENKDGSNNALVLTQ
ncbi:hypothetical protein HANVADRAFT_53018 [Hanseniaspora valbyensis NRRL Y-1626]|uniref:Brl1/Brr6 domain-containing protein n=1 Tax=Hanseniaspora valbyensis NRRL Y-1626 TaxID=766949 RepID=A0A1B7TCU4_9ASCO|nr:hypothetical protein HANVADRAFT_53018 [Hanseniaspora valbyensis NRRL Y-1626]